MEVGEVFHAGGPAHILMYINETHQPWVIQPDRLKIQLKSAEVWVDSLVCPPGRGIVRVKNKTSTEAWLWRVETIENAMLWADQQRLRLYGWLPGPTVNVISYQKTDFTVPTPLNLIEKYLAEGDPKRYALGDVADGFVMYVPRFLRRYDNFYRQVAMNNEVDQERIFYEILALVPAEAESVPGLSTDAILVRTSWTNRVLRRYFREELHEALMWGVNHDFLGPLDQGRHRILKRP